MNPEQERPLDLEPLLGVKEVANYLGIPVQTIYDWRVRGKGPQAYRIGKRLRYAISDVRAWVDSQRDDAVPPPTPRPSLPPTTKSRPHPWARRHD